MFVVALPFLLIFAVLYAFFWISKKWFRCGAGATDAMYDTCLSILKGGLRARGKKEDWEL